MRIQHPCLAAVVTLFAWTSWSPAADSPTVDIGQPTAIVLEPGAFTLMGPRSRQQLLVTGQYANQEVRDLTTAAVFTSTNPAAAKVDGSVVLPVVKNREGGFLAYSDPEQQERVIGWLMQLVASYDGLVLDFAGGLGYTDFVAALVERVHAHNKRVEVILIMLLRLGQHTQL